MALGSNKEFLSPDSPPIAISWKGSHREGSPETDNLGLACGHWPLPGLSLSTEVLNQMTSVLSPDICKFVSSRVGGWPHHFFEFPS